ncbi:phage Gp37/Gp68 family protein [Helicobacter burdigaliensis]|uniref:phage Gp37/Gp68 family protein n=1 Tax=Helicobacter burdigaliensis TaxID=2315334 RepID=UPI000EF6C845|nr:phage Gp37/Gp68 family protein [Helicobacter burdigaliensis]
MGKFTSYNPTIGCTKVSDGCKNCYAESMAKRLQDLGNETYKDGFAFKMLPKRLEEPLRNKKPTLYFVNSMSDLFREKMDYTFLDSILQVIKQTPHHQYQILTKRPLRMRQYFLGDSGDFGGVFNENLSGDLKKDDGNAKRVLIKGLEEGISNYQSIHAGSHCFGGGKTREIPKNVWLGTTIESYKVKERIELIRDIPAPIKWLCCEPLLSDLGELDLSGIGWVVVGGESGARARRMQKEWVLNIKRQCEEQNVAFFFKQWGAYGEDGVKRRKKENGAKLDGKIYQEYPKNAPAFIFNNFEQKQNQTPSLFD